ncbi:MAG: hypothetical protein GAK38_01408 [Xylophilus sp.]|nr:MAG: hypothetical protein GAK38_01408 [Xylophilus sp.]
MRSEVASRRPSSTPSIVLLDHWIATLQAGGQAGAHAAAIGRFAAQLATLRQMSFAVTARLAQGGSPVVEAALVKDIGTMFEQFIPAFVADAIAADPAALPDEQLLRTAAYVTQVAPTYSLCGGTREILRGRIARGLGLR